MANANETKIQEELPQQIDTLSLRRYQEIICAQAVHTNTIAFLPTGTGKTLIACHVISQRLQALRLQREGVDQNREACRSAKAESTTSKVGELSQKKSSHDERDWKKVMVFVAPKRVLVQQQMEYVRKNCLSEPKVGAFTGDMLYTFKHVRKGEQHEYSNNIFENILKREQSLTVDAFTKSHWKEQTELFEVLFMTPDVLRRPLEMQLIPIRSIDFVVLDECHHIKGNGPMGKLCDVIRFNVDQYISRSSQEDDGFAGPLILGLTASPINEKGGDVEKLVEELENRMMSHFCYPTDEFIASLNEHTLPPTMLIVPYEGKNNTQPVVDCVTLSIESVTSELESLVNTISTALGLKELAQCCLLRNILPVDKLKGLCDVQQAALDQLLAQRNVSNALTVMDFALYRGLSGIKEIVNQTNMVTSDCGIYCGISAFAILLRNEIGRRKKKHLTVDSVLEEKESCEEEGAIKLSTISQNVLLLSLFMETTIIQDNAAIEEGTSFKSNVNITQLEAIAANAEFLSPAQFVQSLCRQAHLVVFTLCSVLRVFVRTAAMILSECERIILQETIEDEASRYRAASPTKSPMEDDLVAVVIEMLCLSNNAGEIDIIKILSDSEYLLVDELAIFELLMRIAELLRDSLSLKNVNDKFARAVEDNATACPSLPSHIAFDEMYSLLFSRKCEALLNQLATVHAMQEEFDRAVQVPLPISATQRTFEMSEVSGFFCVEAMSTERLLKSWRRACAVSTESDCAITMVFCNLRVVAQCLFELTQRLFSSQQTSLRSAIMLGTHSAQSLKDTLAAVKRQEFNLVFVTDMAEEGIDIQRCAVILHFDDPHRDVSFIQRRGRARSARSLSIHFILSMFEFQTRPRRIPFIPKRSKALTELELFCVREKGTKERLREYLNGFGGIRKMAGNVVHHKEARDGVLLHYCVPSKNANASVDVVSAISLLFEWCCSMAESEGNTYSRVLPTFVFTNLKSSEEKQSTQDALYRPYTFSDVFSLSDTTRQSWKCCTLTFPEQRVGDVSFPVFRATASSFKLAKGLVALQAIRYLHTLKDGNRQYIDDHLRLVRHVSLSHIENLRVCGNAKQKCSRAHILMECLAINIKNRPELFYQNEVRTASRDEKEKRVRIYFYRISASVCAHSHARSSETQNELSDKQRLQLDALQSLLIATHTPFSAHHSDATITVPAMMQDMSLTLSYTPLVEREFAFDSDELMLLRLFHERVCHIRTVLPHAETFGAVNAANEGSLRTIQAHTPFLVEVSGEERQQHAASSHHYMRERNDVLEDYFLAPQSVRGDLMNVEELREAVQQLHILIHNLCIIQRRNLESHVSIRFFNPHPPPPQGIDILAHTCRSHDAAKDKLSGMLFTTDGRNLMSLCRDVNEVKEKTMSNTLRSGVKFAEYFQRRIENDNGVIENLVTMEQLTTKKSLPPVYMMSGKLTLIDMFAHTYNDLYEHTTAHCLPELCQLVGVARWYHAMLFAPALCFKFECIYHAFELDAWVRSIVAPYLTHTTDSAGKQWPNISLLLLAMTPPRNLENTSSERLEFLGDSFLKYYATLSVFLSNTKAKEGALTSMRTAIIRNEYLTQIAQQHKLSEFLRVLPMCDGRQSVLFTMPHSDTYSPEAQAFPSYSLTHSLRNINVHVIGPKPTAKECEENIELPVVSDENSSATDSTESSASDSSSSESLTNVLSDLTLKTIQRDRSRMFTLFLPQKLLADFVEALVGAFVHIRSLTHAAALLHALNVISKPLIPSSSGDNAHSQLNLSIGDAVQHYLTQTLLPSLDACAEVLPVTLSEAEHIEQCCGYSFKNRRLCALAFTHRSCSSTHSYERLELLGDAVLDFLVVQALYDAHPQWDEGKLSQGKTGVTNNLHLARVAMECGFVKLLRCNSTQVMQEMLRLQEQFQRDLETAIDESSSDAKSGKYCSQSQSQSSKVAADLVESLLGAVFLDCGGDLEVVRSCVEKMRVCEVRLH